MLYFLECFELAKSALHPLSARRRSASSFCSAQRKTRNNEHYHHAESGDERILPDTEKGHAGTGGGSRACAFPPGSRPFAFSSGTFPARPIESEPSSSWTTGGNE
ncbi:unnamed protein product [Polarella glacialis]|uniref:Uncharacterized protein n=1 Tax=Polarella glacialis TaxID=89957 RepID=A0A813KMJ8_POLGL|nr:unnamed protein product [Polarella glacialis]